MKNDNDLFYTCSLIEFIGRKQKLKRSEVVSALSEKHCGGYINMPMFSTVNQ